jgi:hypothetical protein
MLGLSKIRQNTFIVLSFVMNTVAIVVIGWIAMSLV